MDLKIFAIAVTFYAEAEVGVLRFTDLEHLLIIVHFDKFCLSFENSLVFPNFPVDPFQNLILSSTLQVDLPSYLSGLSFSWSQAHFCLLKLGLPPVPVSAPAICSRNVSVKRTAGTNTRELLFYASPRLVALVVALLFAVVRVVVVVRIFRFTGFVVDRAVDVFLQVER